MRLRNGLQVTAIALSIGLMAVGAEAGAPAKPKKGEKAPPPPPANIEEVHIKGAWMRAARRGENGYIFLTVKNESASQVRLKGGDVDVAKRVRIVQFKKHGPMLRPVMIGPVPVEGHETYNFEPGIVALELQELTRDLQKGAVLPVTIAFARAGEKDVEVEIDSRSAVRYPEPPEEKKEAQ